MTHSKAPTQIVISMLYRDAANWKTRESYSFLNKEGVSEECLHSALSQIIDEDEFIPAKYGMPSPAPYSFAHEAPAEGDDHCFVEISDIDYIYDDQTVTAHSQDEDIGEIIENLKRGHYQGYEDDIKKWTFDHAQNSVEACLGPGYEIISKADLNELKMKAENPLPIGISAEFVARQAVMALSYKPMRKVTIDSGISHSDLTKIESDLLKFIGM